MIKDFRLRVGARDAYFFENTKLWTKSNLFTKPALLLSWIMP